MTSSTHSWFIPPPRQFTAAELLAGVNKNGQRILILAGLPYPVLAHEMAYCLSSDEESDDGTRGKEIYDFTKVIQICGNTDCCHVEHLLLEDVGYPEASDDFEIECEYADQKNLQRM